MVFPVVMYRCESWTIKKAECQRINDFELWYWKKLLGVPWTARRSNQSILKEIDLNIHWKDWCWSWSSNTFGHLMRRVDSLEKTLMLGKIEVRRRRRWQSMRWLDGITDSWVWANSGIWWRTGKPGMLQSMGAQRVENEQQPPPSVDTRERQIRQGPAHMWEPLPSPTPAMINMCLLSLHSGAILDLLDYLALLSLETSY